MADSYNELFGLGSHSPDANLEGWWPLQDDAASTAVSDQSGHGRNGVLQGGDNTADIASTGPNGWLASALHFDGTADYISVGDDSGFSPSSGMSICVRANPDALPPASNGNRMWALAKGAASNFEWQLSINSFSSNFGKWVFTRYGSLSGASYRERASSTNAGTDWQSVVAASAGPTSTPDLYRDGLLDNGATGTAGSPVAINGTASVTIGERGDNVDLTFDGLQAEIVIFSRELTAAEALQWHSGPEPINSVAPVVSGTETVGQTLSCTTGTWGLDAPFSSGSNGTITYAYQWTRSDDNSGTGEADISGATSSTYELQSGDSGKYIRCRVRASNTGGYDPDADTESNFTGAIGGGSSAAKQFLQSTADTANATIYTFASQNLGTAEAGRYIVVTVHSRAGTSGVTLSSVTVAGVTATIVRQATNSDAGFSGIAALAIAAVPSGTSGDVVVTFSAGCARATIKLYRLTGINSATPTDSDSAVTTDPSVNLDIPAGGVAIGAGTSGGTPPTTWTGLTEDSDTTAESNMTATSASDIFVGAETGRTITIDWASQQEPVGVFASWAPAAASAAIVRGYIGGGYGAFFGG